MMRRAIRVVIVSVLLLAGGRRAPGAPPGRAAPGEPAGARPAGIIAFSSLAPRGWDLYLFEVASRRTRRLTDHPALDFNAAFATDGRSLAFISTRDGNHELYATTIDGAMPRRLTEDFAMDDHPAWSPDGTQVVFSSTRQPSDRPGLAWNALYVLRIDRARGGSSSGPAVDSEVRRLSPAGVADYSPAWSPKGDLIACASGSGQAGGTDIAVMAPDGSGRRRVVKDGGWPAFAADGRPLFFHGKRQGRWGVWRVGLDGSGLERITPQDDDAFTPSASGDGSRLAVAVSRNDHRQIGLVDLSSRGLTVLTDEPVDHWNPTISPDGRFIAYHKSTPGVDVPNVEPWGAPPETDLRLFRLAGAFPAFAPDGRRLALTGGSFAQLDVMNVDGSGRRTLHEGRQRALFSTSWAHHGDRIAFALGPAFAGAKDEVDIATIRPDGSDFTRLTRSAGNNGFPAFAPDGRRLVFRSGRGGSKNLAIMDADGSNVRPLTEGKWTDTMADWSPDGRWIVFASDRGGDFEIWRIQPDGTGLHQIVGGGSRNNHPHFAPDGRWIVFTSRRAGFSAEEISLPHQPQPYGDLFAVQLDGTGLVRLTHNGFEEGTPAWGPRLASDIVPGAANRSTTGDDY
jgi:Tol biopolymer transport system component